MSDYSIDPRPSSTSGAISPRSGGSSRTNELDETITHRFGDVYERAALGELDDWAEEPNGALALVILLDQFPRNMFRGRPEAFATDEKALAIAKAALARGDQWHVGEDINQFFAMPLMHSENLADQDECVRWMNEIGEENVPFAVEHRDIVARFGRFPIATRCLAGTPRPRKRRFSTRAALPVEPVPSSTAFARNVRAMNTNV